MKIRTRLLFLVLSILAFGTLYLSPFAGPAAAQNQHPALATTDGGAVAKLAYPPTRTAEVFEDYFGAKVADPYRWLEDNESAEVAAWVEAQNKLTFAYLDKIPYRTQLKERLTALLNYPKYSAPSPRGEWFFFSKNDGLQN